MPTVTNRANYIHWIDDLLGLSSPEPNESGEPQGLLWGRSQTNQVRRGGCCGAGAKQIRCTAGAAVGRLDSERRQSWEVGGAVVG